MYTTQDILASVANEHNLIKHLHAKLLPEHLSYKPNEHQRSIKELLEYMSRMTMTMGTMLKNMEPNAEVNKGFREKSESMNMITDFPAAMDTQLAFLESFLTDASVEHMETEVDLFGSGFAMPIKSYLINILFKNYPAYRMQLFHYMKDGLEMTELNTMNLWMGVDGTM